MVGVHAGLHLEHHAGEIISGIAELLYRGGGTGLGGQCLLVGCPAGGGWGERAQGVQDLVHTEVQHRGGEDHRRGHALQEELLIVQCAIGSQQLGLLDGRLPHIPLAVGGFTRGVVLLRGDRGTTGGAGEVDVLLRVAVLVDAGESPEVPGLTDRPEQWSGLQIDLADDLLHQVQGVPAHPVPLVNHRDDGQPTGLTHPEQLQGLRLQALTAVDEHHRGIHGGEHAVGVLREVRVARSIHQVDDVGLALVPLRCVVELQCRGTDRDAAVLLHLHPVGDGGLAPRLAVHRAGLLNDVGVQRQRLGEGGLTGVRVGDDGEGTASGGFSSSVGVHEYPG